MSGQKLQTEHPWGPSATIFLTVLIGVVFVLSQVAVVIPYLAWTAGEGSEVELKDALSSLGTDGRFLAISAICTCVPTLGLTFFLVRLRGGPGIREYLGIRATRPVIVLRWCLYTAVLAVALDGITALMGYPLVPEWMRETYRTAGSLPLLLVAVHVVAPTVEETVFRGFMLDGIRGSRLGDVGSIALVALVWAVIHVQYSAIYMAQIFILGILLGIARVRTGSLLVPIAMHAVFGVISTIHLARAVQ